MVVDSDDVKFAHITGELPMYVFPEKHVRIAADRDPDVAGHVRVPWDAVDADVRLDVLQPSDTTTECLYKGTARYWNIALNGRIAADVAWSYDDEVDGERLQPTPVDK